MNKKGFTLVELLVTIVIIGLISYLSFPPLIRVITDTNAKREFEYYGNSMVDAAKVYLKKEATDLHEGNKFGSNGHNVSLNVLITDEYINAPSFSKKSMSCEMDDNKAFVNIKYDSSNKSYKLSYNLECKDTSAGKKFTKLYTSDEFVTDDL